MQILDQYEAVSFGDALFGCFVLIPMMQRHKMVLRRAVWGEHATLLRSLSVPLAELPMPVESFLHPEEDGVELIRLYARALFGRAVSPTFCPAPYLIAVHHLNSFIYSQQNKNEDERKLKAGVWKQISALSEQVRGFSISVYTGWECTVPII